MVSKFLKRRRRRRRGTAGHPTTPITAKMAALVNRHDKDCTARPSTTTTTTNNPSFSSPSSSFLTSNNNVLQSDGTIVVLDWPKKSSSSSSGGGGGRGGSATLLVENNNKRRQEDGRDDDDDERLIGDFAADEQSYYDDSIECYYLDSSMDSTYYDDDHDDDDKDETLTNNDKNDDHPRNKAKEQTDTPDRHDSEQEDQHRDQERTVSVYEKHNDDEKSVLDGTTVDEKAGRDDRPETSFIRKKKTVATLLPKEETNQPQLTLPSSSPAPASLTSKNRRGWLLKHLFRERNDSNTDDDDNVSQKNNTAEKKDREKARTQNNDYGRRRREQQDRENVLSSQDYLDWSTAGDTNGGSGGGGIWTMVTTTMMALPSLLLQKKKDILLKPNEGSNDEQNVTAVDRNNRGMARGRIDNIIQSLVHIYIDEYIDDDDCNYDHDDDGVSCLSDGLHSAWNNSSLRSMHSNRYVAHHHRRISSINVNETGLRQQLSEPPTPKQSLECVLPNILYFDDRQKSHDGNGDHDYDDDDNSDDLEDQFLSRKTGNDDDGRRYEPITTKDKFRLLFPKYQDGVPRTKERADNSFIGSKDGCHDVKDDSREPVTESMRDYDQLLPEMRSLVTESPSISISATNDEDQYQDERTVAASEVTMDTYVGGFNKATMKYDGEDLVEKIEFMVYPQTNDGDDMNVTSSFLSFVWSRLVEIPKTLFRDQGVNSDENNDDDTSVEISSAAGRDVDGDVDNDSEGMSLEGFDLSSQVESSQQSSGENGSWRISNGWFDWPSEVVTMLATEFGTRTTNMIGELDVPSCGVFFNIPNHVKHAIEKAFASENDEEESDRGSSIPTVVTNSSKTPVESFDEKNIESKTLGSQGCKTSTTLANNKTIFTTASDLVVPPTNESSTDKAKCQSSSSSESPSVMVAAAAAADDEITPKQDLGVTPTDIVSDLVSGDDDDGFDSDDDRDLLVEDTEELASGDDETTTLRSIWDDFDPLQMLKWWSLYPFNNNDDDDDGDY